jgi:hypothetical protein
MHTESDRAQNAAADGRACRERRPLTSASECPPETGAGVGGGVCHSSAASAARSGVASANRKTNGLNLLITSSRRGGKSAPAPRELDTFIDQLRREYFVRLSRLHSASAAPLRVQIASAILTERATTQSMAQRSARCAECVPLQC